MLQSFIILFLAATPPSDPEAVKIFEAAVKAQTPDAAKPTLDAYEATFNVRIWEKDEDGVMRSREARIEQLWQRQPKRNKYRRVLRNNIGDEKPVTVICDGRRYWRRKDGKRAQDLGGDATLRKDLDDLKDEIRRTDELMDLFFLANLRMPGGSITLGAKDLQIPNPAKPKRKLTVHEIVVTRPGKRTVTLRIDSKKYLVHEVHLAPMKKDAPREHFVFSFHKTLKDKALGKVLIPQSVLYVKNGKKVMQATSPPGEIGDSVRLNPKLKRRDFSP